MLPVAIAILSGRVQKNVTAAIELTTVAGLRPQLSGQKTHTTPALQMNAEAMSQWATISRQVEGALNEVSFYTTAYPRPS